MMLGNNLEITNVEAVMEKNEIQGREISEVDEAREQQAAEAMAEVFTPEVISNWENLSLEEKNALLQEYEDKLTDILGLESIEVIVEPMEPGLFGYTKGGNGEIHISAEILSDPQMFKEVLDTVSHETRHCFQLNVIQHPENYPDVPQEYVSEWKNNWENYIDSSVDYEGYYKQPIEVDARDFAEDVVDRFLNELSV